RTFRPLRDRMLVAVRNGFRNKQDTISQHTLQQTYAIQGFIFKSGSILHPFFGDLLQKPLEQRNAERVLTHLLQKAGCSGNTTTIYSVQGLEQDVHFTDQVLQNTGLSRSYSSTYFLMNLDEPVRIPKQPTGFELATHFDLEDLYPLQAAYEQEEVLPPGTIFREQHCRTGLKQLLQQQRIIYGTYNGIPAAKANTNAQSYHRYQLGGIYVVPEFRGKGIGTYIVGKLIEELQKDDKGISLFVKKENQPALRLYQNLGFRISAEYRISYY
ncbi:MAG: GNAT family N-acetyltransferase, partial [Termitinemataceae bacterium]